MMSVRKTMDDEIINYAQIPLRALNTSSRLLLSSSLNPEQLIAGDNGLARDHRGLAEILGFSYSELRNFQRSTDPTKALLEAVEVTPRRLKTNETSSNEPREITFQDLNFILEQIERFDVIDDLQPFLENDAHQYLQNEQNKQSLLSKPYNESQLRPAFPGSDWTLKPSYFPDSPHILTVDDVENNSVLIQYDAYVCYADEDKPFVESLVSRLESPEIGFRLFVRDRDLLLGAMKYDVFTRLIEERCNRMVVILSPDFLNCSECEFQARYATSLGIERRCRMIIPILYKSCDLPASIKMISKINLTQDNNQVTGWNWRKIIASIRGPSDMSSMRNPVSLPRIEQIESSKIVELPSLPSVSDSGFVLPSPSAPPRSESFFKELNGSDETTLATTAVEAPTVSALDSLSQSSRKSEKKNWFKSIKQRVYGSSRIQTESHNGYQSLNKNC